MFKIINYIKNNNNNVLNKINKYYCTTTIKSSSPIINSSNNNNSNSSNKKILITTPIFYVNGPPHIGHLYTALLGDAFSRWNRFKGNDTFFMTGTDEHGMKVEEAAKKNGLETIDYCNNISNKFKELFKLSDIKFDDFIRTTEPRHKDAVSAMWNQLLKNGYIYKGVYKGWYCMSDESFLTDDQVMEGMSPITPSNPVSKKCMISKESGHEVTWVEEENYMFKLSEFTSKVENWLKEDQDSVFPSIYKPQLLSMLSQGIKDLSISRPSSRIKWGIPVPNDPTQTIYVWLDALTNYLTVTGYPNINPNDPSSYWSNTHHIIGKDILKFHCIYWPSFLMAAQYPLQKGVICHAHWTVNREKMSKSRGNVVDPFESIQNYGLEVIRFFLLKGGGLEFDGDWSDHEISVRLKADLADTYGNLLSRCTGKALHPTGQWPKSIDLSNLDGSNSLLTERDIQLLNHCNKLVSSIETNYDKGDFKSGIYDILTFLYDCNGYIQEQKPWTLTPKPNNSNPDPIRLNTIMYIALEMIRIVSLLLLPVIPSSSTLALNQLDIPLNQRTFNNLALGFNYFDRDNNQIPNNSIILFKQLNKSK